MKYLKNSDQQHYCNYDAGRKRVLVSGEWLGIPMIVAEFNFYFRLCFWAIEKT